MLVSALLALPFALLTALGLPIKFKEETSLFFLAALGLWFMFLCIFTAPFWLWRKNKKTIEDLENARKIKLTVHTGDGRMFRQKTHVDSSYVKTTVFVGVRNESNSDVVRGVELTMANLVGGSEMDTHDLDMRSAAWSDAPLRPCCSMSTLAAR